MQEKSIKILLVAIILVLVVSNFSLSRRLSNLETAINHNTHQTYFSLFTEINSLHNMMANISREVNAVADQIVESASLSFNETVRIQRYDRQDATADIAISFYLRQYNPADTVSVIVNGESGQHSAVATFTNGRFVATLSLPARENYSITFVTDGDTITTGQLMQFNLADKLCGRFIFWVNQDWARSLIDLNADWESEETTFTITPFLQNRTYGDAMLKLGSVSLHIESGGNRVRSLDLTDYLQTHGDIQELAFRNSIINFTVGDGPRQINPEEYAIIRLVMYDNLGIRYEQIEALHAISMLVNVHGGHGQEYGIIRITN